MLNRSIINLPSLVEIETHREQNSEPINRDIPIHSFCIDFLSDREERKHKNYNQVQHSENVDSEAVST
jgi:hypothetical protein